MGTGTPWSTPFASINWDNTQSDVEAKVKGMVGGGCSDRTIPVSFSMNAQTAGADAYIIGPHIVKVTGTIKVSCNCSWASTGDMSSTLGYDASDCDASTRAAV